jgi:hypothetical protein
MLPIFKPPVLGFKFDEVVKSRKTPFSVIPAKAGIQFNQTVTVPLDSGFRRSDDFLRNRQVLGVNTLDVSLNQ